MRVFETFLEQNVQRQINSKIICRFVLIGGKNNLHWVLLYTMWNSPGKYHLADSLNWCFKTEFEEQLVKECELIQQHCIMLDSDYTNEVCLVRHRVSTRINDGVSCGPIAMMCLVQQLLAIKFNTVIDEFFIDEE